MKPLRPFTLINATLYPVQACCNLKIEKRSVFAGFATRGGSFHTLYHGKRAARACSQDVAHWDGRLLCNGVRRPPGGQGRSPRRRGAPIRSTHDGGALARNGEEHGGRTGSVKRRRYPPYRLRSWLLLIGGCPRVSRVYFRRRADVLPPRGGRHTRR